MVYYKEATAVTHCSELSRGDTMLLSDLLSMDNDSLYEVYVAAVKNKDLPVINTVRSVVADRYSIRALKQSPLDNWKSNPEITKFFTVNNL